MNQDPIKATWCISNNIGDALTPYLIEKITGQAPIYVEPHLRTPKFMVAGSMLNHATDFTTVWGAGLADFQHNAPPFAIYKAVRGPHTARRCRMQSLGNNPVLGDPALLMPRFCVCSGNVEKKYKVGICPHYVHQAEVAQWIGDRDDILMLNVFDDPQTFAIRMNECEVVYSSSLHGLIFADAYGIPSQWIDGTAQLGGDGMKFADHLVIRHFLGMEDPVEGYADLLKASRDPVIPLEIGLRKIHFKELSRDVDALRDALIGTPPPDFTELTEALWEACPFKPKENTDA